MNLFLHLLDAVMKFHFIKKDKITSMNDKYMSNETGKKNCNPVKY